MKQDLVSVIIPTYNRAHLIGETLDSIIEQSYTNWECIVVDDGSIDYTPELLEFYTAMEPRIKFFSRRAKRPKGANTCRNFGFEKSEGIYINWFDSDDLMHSNKLELQVKALEKSDLNFSVCQTLVFRNSDKQDIWLRHPRIFSENALEDYISIQIVWLTQAPLWRRSFLKSMGYLFDEELQAAQEWEFHCRCLFKSPIYHFTEKPLVYVRQHSNSISFSNDIQRQSNYYLAREKVSDFLRSHKYYSQFLSEYFLGFYRKNLINGNLDLAYDILCKSLLPDKLINLKYRLKLIIAYFSYLTFGRGEKFLKNKKFVEK